jgi:hypothetical protein
MLPFALARPETGRLGHRKFNEREFIFLPLKYLPTYDICNTVPHIFGYR